MSDKIVISVDGTPLAQPRPRGARKGKCIHFYTSSKIKDWKKRIHYSSKKHWNKCYIKPVEVVLTFKFLRPRYHYRSGENKHLLKEQAPKYHTYKPDIDNLIKPVLDALSECNVWHDDKQVIKVTASKTYIPWGVTYSGVDIELNFIND